VFIVGSVYFIMIQSGNFWIHPHRFRILYKPQILCNSEREDTIIVVWLQGITVVFTQEWGNTVTLVSTDDAAEQIRVRYFSKTSLWCYRCDNVIRFDIGEEV